MKLLALLAFIASLNALHGCSLSLRDQVSLIELNRGFVHPGNGETHLTAGERVDCATLPPFVFIRRPNAGSVYILDERRVFQRWSITGVAMDGNWVRMIDVYLQQYSSIDDWAWWREYGTRRLMVQPLTELSVINWRQLRLVSAFEFKEAKKQQLSLVDQTFLQRLIEEKLRAYVSANRPADTQIQNVAYAAISAYDGQTAISVRVRRSGRDEALAFDLPINHLVAPFVGYPRVR